MEWSWRTILILAGLLVIAAILFDGFRRMKQARAEALRLDIQPGTDDSEDDYNPELPGSVRVVSKGESKVEPIVERREPTLDLDEETDFAPEVLTQKPVNVEAELASDAPQSSAVNSEDIVADSEPLQHDDYGDDELLIATQPSAEPEIQALPLI
ncbi:MAG: hypothetical protein VW274_02475, partial [Thalassolituus sp.]